MELRDRMDLASYLLKPVQRMGKYALLLQQLMKMAKGDTEYLRQAESMVRFQLRHGNDLLAMDSLRECDVNLKEQGRLLRQNEFLVWQGKGKKCLRQVFLFEELILFSKARRFPDRTVSTVHPIACLTQNCFLFFFRERLIFYVLCNFVRAYIESGLIRVQEQYKNQ